MSAGIYFSLRLAAGLIFGEVRKLVLYSCDRVHEIDITSLRKRMADLLMEIEWISATGAVMAIGDKQGPIPGRMPREGTMHTVSARDIVRGQLASDVEQFLANGGIIESVSNYVRSESQDKVESNHGSGPVQ